MAGFRDIVGHGQIIAHLKNAISMDKASHAYILDGPDHSGKRLIAEAFAMALQCETVQRIIFGGEEPELETLFEIPVETASGVSEAALERARGIEPCLECRSCRQAAGKNQPDIIYVTHEKTVLSVDDVRKQINEDISIKPYSSKYKVYIVDEAEKMNIQAQNALLKTIEEPPGYAVILLLTTNADGFLPTIRSRCVMLHLKAVEDSLIREFLMRHCQIPDYQADLCVAFAQGNVGQAMLLASSEEFNELKDYAVQLIRRLGDIPVYDLMQELKPLNDYKEKIQVFFDLLLLLFRDVLLYKASGQEERLIFKEQSFIVRQIADRGSFPGLNRILEEIGTAGRRIRANVNYELTLELLLLNIKENIA